MNQIIMPFNNFENNLNQNGDPCNINSNIQFSDKRLESRISSESKNDIRDIHTRRIDFLEGF
jgi:hypothetical protein